MAEQRGSGIDARSLAEAVRLAEQRAWLQDDPAAYRAGVAAVVRELARDLPTDRTAAQAAHLRQLRTG